MIINIGDIIASEFGEGPVVAITKDWVVHDCGNGTEAAIPKDDGQFWIPVSGYGLNGSIHSSGCLQSIL